MNLALNELKVQAKMMLKMVKSGNVLQAKLMRDLKVIKLDDPKEIKLKHCQFFIAKQYGFDDWQHIRQVFSGTKSNDAKMNMGTFLHSSRCDALINFWFAEYTEAQEALLFDKDNRWLIPYKQQYIVVNNEYLKMIGLDNRFVRQWQNINHDLVEGYNSDSWDELALAVLKNVKLETTNSVKPS
jgi:hypothetical protein